MSLTKKYFLWLPSPDIRGNARREACVSSPRAEPAHGRPDPVRVHTELLQFAICGSERYSRTPIDSRTKLVGEVAIYENTDDTGNIVTTNIDMTVRLAELASSTVTRVDEFCVAESEMEDGNKIK
ncbi:hypothetical protein EVAR_60899_1 [Eumeta japonica]|uniref:Uncharacterized protein n=1 Tax=Eumeta variegata TaxID=151549 RepID=A0A4C1ZJW6_EUMVA|nr:hypothetical protein EVAR_60899_1 [Eumeta japonica]